MGLINSLIEEKWLKTPRIIEAFKKVKRADFLPEGRKALAELNEALPIGYGQTISQPLVVAFMFELLQPRPGEKILDLGSGSGWTAVLLAYIVGKRGRVVAIERIPQLVEFAKKNASPYSFLKSGSLRFVCLNGLNGYEEEAPYDRILSSAASQKGLPPAWKKQIKIGGRIVAPILDSIWLFEKISENDFLEKEYPGFAFVPLIEE